MKKLITLPLLIGALGLSGSAFGCQLTAWNGGTNGTAVAGGPGDTVDIARYSGLCAMQAAAAADYVQDNSPAAEARMIARFYFLAQGGAGTIFEALSDEPAAGTVGTSAFSVAFDGSQVTVTSGTGTASAAASATGWNSVEVDWSTGGTVNLWVNADATTDLASGTTTDDSGAAGIESVRLGGSADFLFDAYEARRSTAVGLLLNCDADGNTTVGGGDITFVRTELLGGAKASGQPDCDSNGTVGGNDITAVRTIILGG